MFAAATVLELAAGIGLSYVAGFAHVASVLTRFHGHWLIGVGAGLAASFFGYYLVYLVVFSMDADRVPPGTQVGALSAIGFGGLLAHGGGALEIYSLRAEGASLRDARVRLAALAGLEQGILAIAACGAAIAVLTAGMRSRPSASPCRGRSRLFPDSSSRSGSPHDTGNACRSITTGWVSSSTVCR